MKIWIQMSSRVAGFVVVMAMGVLGLLPAQALASGCEEANAWVAQHADSLPRTYAELIQQPMMYRKAIYSASSPETKAALWRAHLEQYLQEHPTLNSKQVEFIQQAIAMLTPEFFQNATAAAGSYQIVAMKTRGSEIFTKDELGSIIAQLGPDEAAAVPGVQCACSTVSDYCGSGHKCYSANCDQVNGCGTLWAYRCNGICYVP